MEIDRPTRDDMLMEVAQVIAQRSTCQRAAVGVVVARDARILVTGYNGAPAGMPHCTHNPWEAVSEKDQAGCTRAVHAEANAIAYAARYGIEIAGADLYTTLAPCLPCAQLIINSGLDRVVYGRPYHDTMGVMLLDDAGLGFTYAWD